MTWGLAGRPVTAWIIGGSGSPLVNCSQRSPPTRSRTSPPSVPPVNCAAPTLTSLPGPKEGAAVALGTSGIMLGAVPGTIYAGLSAGSPTVMRKLHVAFKARGVQVLDARVWGGVMGATRGTLQVMVGGDEA